MRSSILLFGSPLLVKATSSSCYYPSGGLSTDVPCNSTATGFSPCCAPGTPCMSSGLCFDNGLVSRGTCTDPTWKDAACVQYCLDANPSGGIPIVPRAWGDGIQVSAMGWCCDFPLGNGSCGQGFEIHVHAGTVLPTIVGATATSVSVTATSLITTTATTTSASTSTPSAAIDTCKNTNDIAIGAGIGIPAAIAIVSLLLLWLRERRKRSAEMEKEIPKAIDEYPWLTTKTELHQIPSGPDQELDGRGELP